MKRYEVKLTETNFILLNTLSVHEHMKSTGLYPMWGFNPHSKMLKEKIIMERNGANSPRYNLSQQRRDGHWDDRCNEAALGYGRSLEGTGYPQQAITLI